MMKQISKSLLYAAKLSEPFWEHSEKYAAFLINILPSCKEAKKGNDPYTKWTGRTYNYRRLRIWGCEAIVHIPNLIKNRLPTGIKGIFVGVNGISYDIYIPQKGTVISSADVNFHEQIENEDILQQLMSEQVVKPTPMLAIEDDINQFEKYKNTIHYDHEDKLMFQVIYIRIQKGQIVADWVKISNNPKGHQNGRNKDTILAAHLHTYEIQANTVLDKKRASYNGNSSRHVNNKRKKSNDLENSDGINISSTKASARRSDRLKVDNFLECEYDEKLIPDKVNSDTTLSTLSSVITNTSSIDKRIPLFQNHVMNSLNKQQ